jgi:hypothetical protein
MRFPSPLAVLSRALEAIDWSSCCSLMQGDAGLGPRPASGAAGTGHRRGHPGWAAAGRGDAGGIDEAVPVGMAGAASRVVGAFSRIPSCQIKPQLSREPASSARAQAMRPIVFVRALTDISHFMRRSDHPGHPGHTHDHHLQGVSEPPALIELRSPPVRSVRHTQWKRLGVLAVPPFEFLHSSQQPLSAPAGRGEAGS